jgi:predicted nucleic acid-binding protein
MPDKCFLDTNVWVYLYLDSPRLEDNRKQQRAIGLLQESGIRQISTQVLNEASAVLYRKYAIFPDEISQYINRILQIAELHIVQSEDTLQALELIKSYKLSFYDALIVNAALQPGADYGGHAFAHAERTRICHSAVSSLAG